MEKLGSNGKPFVNRGRKRTRQEFPIRCHVVDDHCDALRHIHAAIRRGDLPFSGFRMMHWDAHPDLMVTPDLPADTCFRPHDLYEALQEAEGGIAEWILPLVFQGHLSDLWWVRPNWAHQFRDGVYRFSIGRVRSTGVMRVSSPAPYFVDDRLYCPESLMDECKLLNLNVSMDLDSEVHDDDREDNGIGVPPGEGVGFEKVRAADGAHPGSPRHTKMSASRGGPPTASSARTQGEIFTGDAKAASSMSSATKDEEQRPWVLDICLDYFTTENPFMDELESHLGKGDASLVREFYSRPRFRGSCTKISHSEQVEHERIFREEVTALLRGCSKEAGESSAAASGQSGDLVSKRLRELFEDTPDDLLLCQRFVAIVNRVTLAQRKLVAWADHCSCLPRHTTGTDEVRSAVLRMERLLRCVTRSQGAWLGPPGVVTIARSETDGYVPSDMVGFIEGQVVAMLRRLFDVESGRGLEVVHDEGLDMKVAG